MGLCTNGKQPIIEWQYLGEEKQRILGADNYTINLQQGLCLTEYVIQYLVYGQSGSFTRYSNDDLYFGGIIVNGPIYDYGIATPTITNSLTIKDHYYPSSTSLGHALIVHRNAELTRYDQYYLTSAYGVKLLPPVRYDGQPDNCGGCVLTVTKNNTVVYKKSTPQCPTVSVICGDQCPPGTCQCDCGSMVCCYDTTTGKAIKSFRK